MAAVPVGSVDLVDLDRPRPLARGRSRADLGFEWGTTGVGALVLVITGAIGVFLGVQLVPTIHRYGFGFLTRADYDQRTGVIGIGAAIVGTVEIAAIALVLAFPVAICLALFLTDYAPRAIRGLLVSVLDLMAAVPSIVYAAWGVHALEPHLQYDARWLSEWFGWIPLFAVHGADPHAAQLQTNVFSQSAFIAGTVVALMIVPLAASIMRNVFAQTPIGEREAALALGSTRWGVVRTVVLPFARGGIIGGTMLALGRALGETIAVLFILNTTYTIKVRVLESGSVTISSLIAGNNGTATASLLDALLAAGFVLFLMTLLVNTLAATVVNRSRGGSLAGGH